MRALCDSGCQINLITPDAVQRLRLRKTPVQTQILGLGGAQASKSKVHLDVTSTIDENVSTQLELYVQAKFLGALPQARVDASAWPDIQQLPLADETFHQPGPIDMVLGAQFYSQIVREGVKHFTDGPTAQNTSFGWIVFGKTHIPMCETPIAMPIITNDDLMQALTRFWELENAPMQHRRTPEEQMCEDIFTSTTNRDQSGRYTAHIPMQSNPSPVIGSRQLALGRLNQMHRRFERDPALKEKYIQFMDEYEQLGHMTLVSPKQLNNPKAVYIPHHAAGSEKFRVVFDGSCKMKGNPSPNDLQLNGERLQRDLTFIIARFRLGKVALCADIAKMYRQILVPPEQRDFQRILWSPSANQPIREYRLNTQTYGMKSAAFVCIRTLMECAKSCEEAHPKVADTIRNNFYVDDMLRSEPNAELAIALYRELNAVLSEYGFTLAKWITNDSQVNAIIHGGDAVEIEMNRENTNAVLGVHWNPANDEFRYKVKNPPSDQVPTKRSVVSDIARLFDPDGFLSPIVVRAKMLIQRLWLRKMDWDDVLADSDEERNDGIAKDWAAFRKELTDVEKIRIPRWIRMQPNSTVQIHGFSDASQEAYGVAFYVRVETDDGSTTSNLVFSKTRVAPLTKATVPKLELSAAHLLAKMLSSIMEAHFVSINNCYLWTDSMIALQWLRKCPAKLEVFQANRVAEIQELTEGATWSHVATKDNPSDLCSRGVSPNKLAQSRLWWHGPVWLSSPMTEWPMSNPSLSTAEAKVVEAAVKKPKPVVSVGIIHCDAPLTKIVTIGNARMELGLHETISDWQKLLRVTGYVMRFIINCRQKKRSQRRTGSIKRREIECSEEMWLQYSQGKHFSDVIADLRADREIKRDTPLYRLAPFIDGHGILRLSGRLRRAEMPYDTMHPIVLSSKCTIAHRIIHDAHRVTLHGGVQLMQQYIRNKYWIIGLRIAIRSLTTHCYPCLRQKKQHAEQLMGQLPSSRVQPSRAFLHTSVDYMGPFLVKRYNARRVKIIDKAYGAVFVCMATRAVHLELVSALTTEVFLAAFARFTNRRGRVESLHSDNATNFTGAANEFDAIVADQLAEASKSHAIREQAIAWHFNPPYAPHMGGIHEAAVKSAKHHLRRVIGSQQLTFEELATLLIHVEACLNSRPLTALTDEASDALALTPAHFLIGEPIVCPLMRDQTTVPTNRLNHFELLQKFAQEFWNRWSDEHVKAMLNRTKWCHSHESIKRDDIVLVLSEPRPQAKWPLARVVNLYPDHEGKVRAADIIFEGRMYKRPITQLNVLPKESAFQ